MSAAAISAALACTVLVPGAQAAESAREYHCGFIAPGKTPDFRARYNHCGPTRVNIKVKNIAFTEQDLCVPPGVIDIEGHIDGFRTIDAWYTGLC
ncbi:DUF6355 family natural product biosynthesis protein [Allokutzneria multivorans]